MTAVAKHAKHTQRLEGYREGREGPRRKRKERLVRRVLGGVRVVHKHLALGEPFTDGIRALHAPGPRDLRLMLRDTGNRLAGDRRRTRYEVAKTEMRMCVRRRERDRTIFHPEGHFGAASV